MKQLVKRLGEHGIRGRGGGGGEERVAGTSSRLHGPVTWAC